MVATMPKQKKRVSLNVAPEDAATIMNLATLGGFSSVEEFFKQKEVRQFWAHLSEAARERERARQEELLRKAQK
jgi:hypothetical protein